MGKIKWNNPLLVKNLEEKDNPVPENCKNYQNKEWEFQLKCKQILVWENQVPEKGNFLCKKVRSMKPGRKEVKNKIK